MALFGKQQATPLDGTDLVLADLDGVVYKGKSAVPHAVEALNSAAERMRVGYVTNNASRTATSVAQHLSDLGLTVVADDVVTSPQAAMSLLREAAPEGSTILVVGGEGLESEVLKAGYTITKTADDKPAAVIQGFHPTVAWTDLAQASFALHTGIPWIATNMDWTIPVDGGIAPGNGTLVSAVHTAVGRLPDVAGKPEVPIFEEAIRRFGASNALFIGDRLDTDILGGNRAGLRTALVLTGIDQAKQVLAAPKGSRPTYILPDLRSLTEPYPETVLSKDGSKATVGKASVRIVGYQVEVVNEGNDELNLLRAASAVIWNSSTKIYGLQVPESLYS